MSIISTIYVPEGIVMAADSRITGRQTQDVDGSIETNNFTISDNGQKIVKLNKTRVGIIFCGNMIKDRNTIADYLRLFEIERVAEGDSVEAVANKLLDYIGEFSGTAFMVAGYDNDEPFIYHVTDHIERANLFDGIVKPSISYNGNVEAIQKLLTYAPEVDLGLELMPLKDGVDLAEFLIDLVKKYERFRSGIQTCGGPIDVLVITKDEIFWHKYKLYKTEKEG